jgi:AmmeMemoRadiSam system protein A
MSAAAPRRLDGEERRQLLAIARSSIAAALAGKPASFESVRLTPGLERPSGAFVTITEHRALRGCIGVVEAREPLYRAVASAAASAALGDPRFPSVTAAELPVLELEISVLSPFEQVGSVDEIVVGVHGLVAREGFRAGLLLPQVPVEYGWTRDEFLDHLCAKAGLPRGHWRSGRVQLEKFTAEVFSETTEAVQVGRPQ